jgi:hypothetical protein
MRVGTDIADDGVPAEFKICSLFHVATVEPLPSGPQDSQQTDGNGRR